jgi:hypothetical protein
MAARKRKPTHGKVAGVKFTINKEKEEEDLKKVKARIIKDLEETEAAKNEWLDKEMDKNLKKQ